MSNLMTSADHVKAMFDRAAANRKAWLAGQCSVALMTMGQVNAEIPDGFDPIDRAEFHSVESGRACWIMDAPAPEPTEAEKAADAVSRGVASVRPTLKGEGLSDGEFRNVLIARQDAREAAKVVLFGSADADACGDPRVDQAGNRAARLALSAVLRLRGTSDPDPDGILLETISREDLDRIELEDDGWADDFLTEEQAGWDATPDYDLYPEMPSPAMLVAPIMGGSPDADLERRREAARLYGSRVRRTDPRGPWDVESHERSQAGSQLGHH